MPWIRHYLFIIISFMIFSFDGQGQIKQYVSSNMKVISSINPDSLNFDDLQPIGDAIGEAQVVMLGEQSHGDGATFAAKSRLVKYLHERKGFNVLIFESDFFSLTQGWEQTAKTKESVTQFFRHNLYPIWSLCKQCDDLLFNYIPSTYDTHDPIRIAGIDNQFHGRYTATSMKMFLDSAFKKNLVSYIRSDEYHNFFLPFLDTLSKLNYQKREYLDSLSKSNFSENYIRFGQAIDTILVELGSQMGIEYIVLKNYQVMALQLLHYSSDIPGSIRDERMGDNLIWLAKKKYPGEKLIVWAANRHIMKNGTDMMKTKSLRLESTGNRFVSNEQRKDRTYILGFTSGYGTVKRANSNIAHPIKPALKGLETWIEKSINYGFLDFQKLNRESASYTGHFRSKILGHGSMRGRWTKMFDGIFYIREMTPCTP